MALSIKRKLYLISYDISDTKLRNKIAKTLEGYGRRVQYSVFECCIDEKRIQKLNTEFQQMAGNLTDGSILIYPLCSSCESKKIIIGTVSNGMEELNSPVIIV